MAAMLKVFKLRRAREASFLLFYFTPFPSCMRDSEPLSRLELLGTLGAVRSTGCTQRSSAVEWQSLQTAGRQAVNLLLRGREKSEEPVEVTFFGLEGRQLREGKA